MSHSINELNMTKKVKPPFRGGGINTRRFSGIGEET
jgi:hypothetical protein